MEGKSEDGREKTKKGDRNSGEQGRCYVKE